MPNQPLSPAEIEKARLVDLVGLFQNLTEQKGVNKGSEVAFVCPFHNDRNPSLMVNSDKGVYHCLGCDAKGDAISCVMKLHNIDFVQAVNYLNGKETIKEKYIPKIPQKETTNFVPKEIANSKLLEEFVKQLLPYISGEDWDRVAGYFENRCLSLLDFDLGVSNYPTLYPIPKMNSVAFRRVYESLRTIFNNEEIIEHGLYPENGFSQYQYYDFFFVYYGEAENGEYTITNLQARRIKPEVGQNRECFLKNKQVLPFNLHLLSELPYKSNVFLVESPIDALSLNKIIKAGGFNSYTGGNPYVVSTGGSQIKSDRIIQICQEKEHTVHLCMDNDVAGDKANGDWLMKFTNAGIKAYIPNLIPKRFKDANEYLVAKKDIFCREE